MLSFHVCVFSLTDNWNSGLRQLLQVHLSRGRRWSWRSLLARVVASPLAEASNSWLRTLAAARMDDLNEPKYLY